MLESKLNRWEGRRVECHLHKGLKVVVKGKVRDQNNYERGGVHDEE